MNTDKEPSVRPRQMDDYLMRRIDKLEDFADDMRHELTVISGKLDSIATAQEMNKPSIAAMKSVLDAGGMLKWAVSTIVVICVGFSAVMTAWDAAQKWLGK